MADAREITGRTPLDGVRGPIGGPADAGVVLAERRHLGKLILRGEPDDQAFLAGAAKGLGAAPPTEPNTVVSTTDATVIWLAPNEWLIVTAPGAEAALEAALGGALAETHHAITDVSDNATIIRLAGDAARTVMMKGCSIDLHPRVFAPGKSAQSHLAQALVTFWQVDAVPSYDILVRPSFAAYLWAWLVDAGGEYKVRVEA
jgi:sarcosine oxidase subunit gamma